MKKYFFSALMAIALAATLCMSVLAADITVRNANDLVSIMNDKSKWDDNITLAADIDLTGKAQSPIGNYTTPYTGVFDGAGYTIKGLNINTPEYQLVPVAKEGEEPAPLDPNAVYATLDDICVGLFGVIENATVKNLTVEGSVINNFAAENAETKVDSKYSGTGAIVGMVRTGSTLENLVNKASVFGAGNSGGVAGYVHNFGEGTVNVINCANYGVVDSSVGNIGGVLGRIFTDTVTSDTDTAFVAVTVDGCVNYADLSFTSEDRMRGGGVIGYTRSLDGVLVIKNCRNEGDITASNNGQFSSNIPYVAGIIGRNEMATGASAAIQILDCINLGDINTSRISGGITAYISRGEACNLNQNIVSGCVNLGDVNGSYFAAGIVTYAELNGLLNPGVIENCFTSGNITYDFFPGMEYENTGSNKEAIGGIVARNRGASINNCVNVGTVAQIGEDARVLCGALVGKMDSEMTYPCVIENNYYLYHPMAAGLSMSPFSTTNVALGSADVANKDAYASLDFDSKWTMGEKAPMLAAFAEYAPEISVEEGIVAAEPSGSDIKVPQIPVVTTPVVTTAASTVAVDASGNSSFPVWIVVAIVAAIAVVVAVVVIVVKKKK